MLFWILATNFVHSSPSLAQTQWHRVWERHLLQNSSAAISDVSLTEMFLNSFRCSDAVALLPVPCKWSSGSVSGALFTGIWSHFSPWSERFATFLLSVCSIWVQPQWGFYCVAKIRGILFHPPTTILKSWLLLLSSKMRLLLRRGNNEPFSGAAQNPSKWIFLRHKEQIHTRITFEYVNTPGQGN